MPYHSIGCFKDETTRAIPSIEGITTNLDGTPILDGHYRSRWNAIGKCFHTANNLGYSTFAVQDGGQCFSSNNARDTYNKYGSSTDCKKDGKGGPMANEVYAIKGRGYNLRKIR